MGHLLHNGLTHGALQANDTPPDKHNKVVNSFTTIISHIFSVLTPGGLL